MIATDKTGLMIPTLFAVIMHEAGHLFGMWILECPPTRIRLIPASIQITAPITKRYKNDVIILILGPAVNFLLFGVLYLNYIMFKNETVLYYALINLLIGGFNSLPVKGLDGGSLLKILFSRLFNPQKAEIILNIITAFGGFLLITSGIFLATRQQVNVTVFIMGIYLFISVLLNK
jgi:Zn-dependent protease